MQAVGDMMLVAVNGFLSPWTPTRALARDVHVRLQPQFNELLHSVMLQDGLARAKNLRLVLEISPIKLGRQLGQFLFGDLDPFHPALPIALTFLGGIEPIERIVPVLREMVTLKEVKGFRSAGVIGFGAPPQQSLG